jgi:TonB family protein
MLALALALAAAAPAEPPPRTISGVTVTPAPPTAIEKHPDASVESAGSEAAGDFVAVWPGEQYQMGREGRVSLACRVDVHGLAELCRVTAETPSGKGFGKAALELRPTFKLAPPTGADGQPTAREMVINVTFRQPDRTQFDEAVVEAQNGKVPTHSFADGPLQLHKVTMLDYPVWAAAPSFDDLAAAYPARAGGDEGYVAEHCQVLRSGALTGCSAIKEEPKGEGFSNAARSLTAKFRVDPALARTPHVATLFVDVPIRFPPPASAEMKDRTVMAPVWVAGFETQRALRLFPPEAAARGLTSGRGIARCSIAADGALTACSPEPGEPDGLGFSEAAVKLASTMRMNLWSLDGAPVEGGVIHIPIRLNLKADGPRAGN